MKYIFVSLLLSITLSSCFIRKQKKWSSNMEFIGNEISIQVIYKNPACYCPDWTLTSDIENTEDSLLFHILPLDSNQTIPSKYIYGPNRYILTGRFYKYPKSLGEVESGGYAKTFCYSDYQLTDTVYYYSEGELKFDIIK